MKRPRLERNPRDEWIAEIGILDAEMARLEREYWEAYDQSPPPQGQDFVVEEELSDDPARKVWVMYLRNHDEFYVISDHWWQSVRQDLGNPSRMAGGKGPCGCGLCKKKALN